MGYSINIQKWGSVGQSASSLVCCSFAVCDSVREWRVLGSILAGAGKLSLLCTGLPHFSIIYTVSHSVN